MITTTRSSSFPLPPANPSRPTLAAHPSENGTLQSSVSSMTWSHTGVSMRSILSTSARDVGGGVDTCEAADQNRAGDQTQQQHDKGVPPAGTTGTLNYQSSPTKQVAFAPELSFTIPEDDAKPIFSDDHWQLAATPTNRFHQSASAAEQPSFFQRMPPSEQRQQGKLRSEQHLSPSQQLSMSHHQLGVKSIPYSFASELCRQGPRLSEELSPPEEQQYEDFCPAQDEEEEEEVRPHRPPSLGMNPPAEHDVVFGPEDELFQEEVTPRDKENRALPASRAANFAPIPDQPERHNNPSTDLVRYPSSHRRSSRERMASWKEKTAQRMTTLSQQRRAWEEQRLLEREEEEKKEQKNGKRAVAEILVFPDSDSSDGYYKKPKQRNIRPPNRRKKGSRRKLASDVNRSASEPALKHRQSQRGFLGSAADMPSSSRPSNDGLDGKIDPSTGVPRPTTVSMASAQSDRGFRAAHPNRAESVRATMGREAHDLTSDGLYESFPAGQRSTRGLTLSDEDVESGGDDVSPDQRRMERMQRKQSRRKQLRRLRQEEKERRDRVFGESSHSFNVVPPIPFSNNESVKDLDKQTLQEDSPPALHQEPIDEAEETSMVDTDMENNGKYEAPPRRKTSASQRLDLEERGEPEWKRSHQQQEEQQQPHIERRRGESGYRAEPEQRRSHPHQQKKQQPHIERRHGDSSYRAEPEQRRNHPQQQKQQQPHIERRRGDSGYRADHERQQNNQQQDQHRPRHAERHRGDSGNQSPQRERSMRYLMLLNPFRLSSSALNQRPASKDERCVSDAEEDNGDNEDDPDAADTEGWNDRSAVERTKRRRAHRRRRRQRRDGGGGSSVEGGFRRWLPRRTRRRAAHFPDKNNRRSEERGKHSSKTTVDDKKNGSRLPRRKSSRSTIEHRKQHREVRHPERQRRPQYEGRQSRSTSALMARPRRPSKKLRKHNSSVLQHEGERDRPSWSPSRSDRRLIRAIVAQNAFDGSEKSQQALAAVAAAVIAAGGRSKMRKASSGSHDPSQSQGDATAKHANRSQRQSFKSGTIDVSESLTKLGRSHSAPDEREVFAAEFLRLHFGNQDVPPGRYGMEPGQTKTRTKNRGEAVTKRRQILFGHKYRSEQWKLDASSRSGEDVRRIVHLSQRKYSNEILRKLSEDFEEATGHFDEFRHDVHHGDQPDDDKIEDFHVTEFTDINDDESQTSESSSVLLEMDTELCRISEDARILMHMMEKICHDMGEESPFRPVSEVIPDLSDVHSNLGMQLRKLDAAGIGHHQRLSPPGSFDQRPGLEGTDCEDESSETEREDYRATYGIIAKASEERATRALSSPSGSRKRQPLETEPLPRCDGQLSPGSANVEQHCNENYLASSVKGRAVEPTLPKESSGGSGFDLEPISSSYNRPPHHPPTLESLGLSPLPNSSDDGKEILYDGSEKPGSTETASALPWWKQFQNQILPKAVKQGHDDYTPATNEGINDQGVPSTSRRNDAPSRTESAATTGREDIDGLARPTLASHPHAKSERSALSSSLRGKRATERPRLKRRVTFADVSSIKKPDYSSDGLNGSLDLGEVFTWAKEGNATTDRPPLSRSPCVGGKSGFGLHLSTDLDHAARERDPARPGAAGVRNDRHFNSEESLTSGEGRTSTSLSLNSGTSDMSVAMADLFGDNDSNPTLQSVRKTPDWRNDRGGVHVTNLNGTGSTNELDCGLNESKAISMEGNCSDDDSEESLSAAPPAIPSQKRQAPTPSHPNRTASLMAKNKETAVYVDFGQGGESEDRYADDSDTSLSVSDIFDKAQPIMVSVEKKMFAAAMAIPVKASSSTEPREKEAVESGTVHQGAGPEATSEAAVAGARKDDGSSEASLSLADLFDTAKPAIVPIQKKMFAAALASPLALPPSRNEEAQKQPLHGKKTPVRSSAEGDLQDGSGSEASLSVSQLFDPAPAVVPIQKKMIAATFASPKQKKPSPQVSHETNNPADPGRGEETAKVSKATNGEGGDSNRRDGGSDTSLSVSQLFDTPSTIVPVQKKLIAAPFSMKPTPSHVTTERDRGEKGKLKNDRSDEDQSACDSETSLSVSQLFDTAGPAVVPVQKKMFAAGLTTAIKSPNSRVVKRSDRFGCDTHGDGGESRTDRNTTAEKSDDSEASLSVSQLFDRASPAVIPVHKKMLATALATPLNFPVASHVTPAIKTALVGRTETSPAVAGDESPVSKDVDSDTIAAPPVSHVTSVTRNSDTGDSDTVDSELTEDEIDAPNNNGSETSLSVSQLFDTAPPAVMPVQKKMFAAVLAAPINPATPAGKTKAGTAHDDPAVREANSADASDSETSLSVSQLFDTATPAVVPVQKKMFAAALATPMKPPTPVAGKKNAGTDSDDPEVREATSADASNSETSLSVSQLFDTATPAVVPVQKKMFAAGLATPIKPTAPAAGKKNVGTDSDDTEVREANSADASNSETSLSVSQLFDTATPSVVPVQKKMFAAALGTPIKPPELRKNPVAKADAGKGVPIDEESTKEADGATSEAGNSEASLSVSQLFDTAAPPVMPIQKKMFAAALATPVKPPVVHVTQAAKYASTADSEMIEKTEKADTADKHGSETSLSVSQLFDTTSPAVVPVQKKTFAAALATPVRSTSGHATSTTEDAKTPSDEAKDAVDDDGSETSLSVSQLFDTTAPSVVPVHKRVFAMALASPIKPQATLPPTSTKTSPSTAYEEEDDGAARRSGPETSGEDAAVASSSELHSAARCGRELRLGWYKEVKLFLEFEPAFSCEDSQTADPSTEVTKESADSIEQSRGTEDDELAPMTFRRSSRASIAIDGRRHSLRRVSVTDCTIVTNDSTVVAGNQVKPSRTASSLPVQKEDCNDDNSISKIEMSPSVRTRSRTDSAVSTISDVTEDCESLTSSGDMNNALGFMLKARSKETNIKRKNDAEKAKDVPLLEGASNSLAEYPNGIVESKDKGNVSGVCLAEIDRSEDMVATQAGLVVSANGSGLQGASILHGPQSNTKESPGGDPPSSNGVRRHRQLGRKGPALGPESEANSISFVANYMYLQCDVADPSSMLRPSSLCHGTGIHGGTDDRIPIQEIRSKRKKKKKKKGANMNFKDSALSESATDFGSDLEDAPEGLHMSWKGEKSGTLHDGEIRLEDPVSADDDYSTENQIDGDDCRPRDGTRQRIKNLPYFPSMSNYGSADPSMLLQNLRQHLLEPEEDHGELEFDVEDSEDAYYEDDGDYYDDDDGPYDDDDYYEGEDYYDDVYYDDEHFDADEYTSDNAGGDSGGNVNNRNGLLVSFGGRPPLPRRAVRTSDVEDMTDEDRGTEDDTDEGSQVDRAVQWMRDLRSRLASTEGFEGASQDESAFSRDSRLKKFLGLGGLSEEIDENLVSFYSARKAQKREARRKKAAAAAASPTVDPPGSGKGRRFLGILRGAGGGGEEGQSQRPPLPPDVIHTPQYSDGPGGRPTPGWHVNQRRPSSSDLSAITWSSGGTKHSLRDEMLSMHWLRGALFHGRKDP